jgi:hypothetical protein
VGNRWIVPSGVLRTAEKLGPLDPNHVERRV